MAENKNITPPSTSKSVPTLGYSEDGVMGSTNTDNNVTQTSVPQTADLPLNKVAVFSNRNLYADGYGNINVGYNIIGNRLAQFWLSQPGVRLVGPEELAEAFA